MTQNIYDNSGFFAGYSQLGRSVHGLDGAAEWPSLRAMLPDLRAARVLDLGCGFGWVCRHAAEAGAAEILGLDVSENMLARARASTTAPTIRYALADLETADLGEAWDLVYSSLAFHYIRDFPGLARRIHAALKPGGHLVLSIEHPIYMAPTNPGFVSDTQGRRIWPLDRYLEEGERHTDWLAKGVVKHHRTLGTTLTTLLRTGFALEHVEEWRPSDAQRAARPELAQEMDRPMFLLVGARK